MFQNNTYLLNNSRTPTANHPLTTVSSSNLI
jgi:hypothetical protein